jgi:hypothetical protein
LKVLAGGALGEEEMIEQLKSTIQKSIAMILALTAALGPNTLPAFGGFQA